MSVARNFDTNTARVPAFFDADTWFYGWKNSEVVPNDKDFKVKYNDLYSAIRTGLASTSGLTNGSVLFAQSSALAQDNANLFWDDTLNRLGVGTNSPASRIHIVGGQITHTPNGSSLAFVANADLYSTTSSYNVIMNVRSPVLSGSNIFFVNNSAVSVGNNTASDVISIGGSNLVSSQTIALGANTTQSNTVLIGWNSSMQNVSPKPTIKTTIVGNNNSGATAVGFGSGIGSIVYGYDNNTVATGNDAGHNYMAIVIGASNDVRQNHTGSVGMQKIVIGKSIIDQQSTVVKNSFGVGIGAYSFIHDLSNNNELYGGLLLTNAGYDQASTNTKYLRNGTAPTTLIADTHAYYSADITAGNAAPHFRTEAGNVIKLYRETTGVAAAAFVANTSGILNDSATFGGYTIGQIVAALKNHGLLA